VRGDEGDVLDPIVRRQRLGVPEDFGVIDGVNLAGTLAGGKRGQDPGARPEIDYAGAGPDVARDRRVVEIHARPVGQHALLLEEIGEIPAVVFTITPLRRVLVRRKKPGGEGWPALHPVPASRQQTPEGRETFYAETLKTLVETWRRGAAAEPGAAAECAHGPASATGSVRRRVGDNAPYHRNSGGCPVESRPCRGIRP
jgi:hypothetical protein